MDRKICNYKFTHCHKTKLIIKSNNGFLLKLTFAIFSLIDTDTFAFKRFSVIQTNSTVLARTWVTGLSFVFYKETKIEKSTMGGQKSIASIKDGSIPWFIIAINKGTINKSYVFVFVWVSTSNNIAILCEMFKKTGTFSCFRQQVLRLFISLWDRSLLFRPPIVNLCFKTWCLLVGILPGNYFCYIQII